MESASRPATSGGSLFNIAKFPSALLRHHHWLAEGPTPSARSTARGLTAQHHRRRQHGTELGGCVSKIKVSNVRGCSPAYTRKNIYMRSHATRPLYGSRRPSADTATKTEPRLRSSPDEYRKMAFSRAERTARRSRLRRIDTKVCPLKDDSQRTSPPGKRRRNGFRFQRRAAAAP